MLKYLLYPLSIIYYLLSELNRILTKSKKLYKPVISIGNVTWGGSGKTPMTVEVAEYILSLGKMPVILSRGYARKNINVKNVVVRDKEKILADIFTSGDDPYMMASRVNCPIELRVLNLQNNLILMFLFWMTVFNIGNFKEIWI